MRHRAQHRKLNRTSAHRKALFRNQLTALFTHERIVTTLAKAKELRPLAERMVTLARTGSLPARRKVLTMVPDKEIVSRLFDDIAPRFMDRPGGYTRIMRVGRRHGDGAELAIIEFVDYELSEHGDGGSSSKEKTSLMDRAKGMFGGGAKAEDETEAAPEELEEQQETVAADGEEPIEESLTEETAVPETETVEAEEEQEPVETAVAEEIDTTSEESEETAEDAVTEVVDEDEEKKD